MHMPTKARSIATRLTLLVASTLVFAACGSDVTAPTASRLAPTDATKALVGGGDGLFTFTVNPSQTYLLKFGESDLSLPANSICKLSTSGYGASYWNSSCTPETGAVTITVMVVGSATNHPSVWFSPAMRFNPTKTVKLTLTVNNTATVSSMSKLWYCALTTFSCVDESLTDASLVTTVMTDSDGWQIYRRIKHFSGYVVAE